MRSLLNQNSSRRTRALAKSLTLSFLIVLVSLVLVHKVSGKAAGAVSHILATSQPVGSIPGTFGVNGNGASTYEIAIQVPPGTNGEAPQLSLSYDSHRPNGYLGMGWQLGGISSIARCGANYRTDAFKAGVEFDARDRFCLDGRRLIATAGVYGADGTTYHTEYETWTVLTSHGTCGSGPCSFTGTSKDGTQLSFGGTTGDGGSRILAQGRTDGAVRAWSIDRHTDLNGNATSVRYISDVTTGEYYPDRIDYTSNAAAGLAAQRSVQFTYSGRSDVIRRYLRGSQVLLSHLLTGITTHVVQSGIDLPVMQYKLAYAASAGSQRSRLTSVTLCDAAGVCQPATQFSWYDNDNSLQPASGTLPGPTYVLLNNQAYPYGILMDLNGDGIADYSPAVQRADGSSDLRVYLGHSDGSFTEAPFHLPGPVWRITASAVLKTGVLQDMNGDGILDYSHALQNDDGKATDLNVFLGSAVGFSSTPAMQLPGPLYWQVNGQTYVTGVLADMNGDGLPDYSRATQMVSSGQKLLAIYRNTGAAWVATGTSLPGPLFSISGSGAWSEAGILRDIDGDGIADYSAAMVNANSGTSDLRVYLGHSPDYTFNASYNLPAQMLWTVNANTFDSGVLVDINGDGIPDYSRATQLLTTGQNLLEVQLGTGGGFTAPAFNLPGPIYAVTGNASFVQGVLSNWNGDDTTRYSRATKFSDGKQDLSLYRGTGTGFTPMDASLPKAMFYSLPAGTYPYAIYEDVNGDGLTDFVDSVCTLNGNGTLSNCSLGIQRGSQPFPDLLRQVTNGFAGSTEITYAPLTSANYQPGTTAYPVRGAVGPTIVVNGYVNRDGRGSHYDYSYRYAGAHQDELGTGWLGFTTVTMTDVATGRQSAANYAQAFPFYGLVVSSRELDRDGNTLSLAGSDYTDMADAAMQQLGIHQPLRTHETYTQYTDGAADYTLTHSFDYDRYGNLAISSDLGGGSGPSQEVFTCSRFANDAATGRYGYVLQEKTATTYAECSGFVAATDPNAIQWNAGTDLRWSKTAYDAHMNVSGRSRYDNVHATFLTDTFLSDAYGNTVQATNTSGAVTDFTWDSTYHSFRNTQTSPTLSRGGSTYRLTTSTLYDARFGTLASTTDPNGNVTSQQFDGFGRPVSVYGPDRNGTATEIVRCQWIASNGAFYLQTQTRPDWGNNDPGTWYWERQYHDGMDRVYRTERNGLQHGASTAIVTETGYDSDGRIGSTTEPYYSGDTRPVTTIEYDLYNRPVLSTDAAGVQRKIDYAQGGLKVSRTDAYGTADAQTEIDYYSTRGLMQQKVDPNGLTTTYGYDPMGQLLSATMSPDARTAALTYDSLGRARTSTSTDTGTTTWTYDASGQLQDVHDAAGNVVHYVSYDAMGRLTGRTMTAAGQTTTALLTYDDPTMSNGLGNLTSVQMHAQAVGDFAYRYAYTANNQVQAGTFTIAGDVYTYGSTYDPMDRVVTATYANGAVLTSTYLADGNLGQLALQEAPSGPNKPYVNYSGYTAMGQVGTVDLPQPGITQQKTYNPPGTSFGQLHTATAAHGSTPLQNFEYTWNRLNSLTNVRDGLQSANSEQYGYQDQELNKHMGFLTSAQGAFPQQTYAYDRLGNAQQNGALNLNYVPGKDWLASTSAGDTFSYYSNGNLKTRSSSTAGSWTYSYDAGGLLTRMDHSSGHTTDSGSAAYDVSGRQVFSQRAGDPLKTYWITRFYEVVDLGAGNFQHTIYVPGENGPIAAITSAGKGIANPAAQHAALHAMYSHSHTLTGSLLGAEHSILSTLARASAISFASICLCTILSACLYGALLQYGSREGRTLGFLRFPHSEDGTVLCRAIVPLLVAALLLLGTQNAFAELTPGPNGSGIPSPGYTYFLQNQTQSTTLVTDESGAVQSRIAYLPYGAIDQAHSSGLDNYRPKFTGTEWDPAARLYHMGSRYYSPDLGRFLSTDPAGQFNNPYMYAGNDPASMIDPNGDFAFVIAVIIGAVLGAYLGGAAVNHSYNPFAWDWRAGKTYAGLIGGAAIGSIGAAAGGLAVEAGIAIGGAGGLAAEAAGIAVGIGGQALVGAGENAAFTALGGGSTQDVLTSAAEGALFAGAFAVAGEAIGGVATQFARRGTGTLEEGAEDLRGLVRNESSAADEAADVCAASFAAGTLVETPHGRVPIQSVHAGQLVQARDLQEGQDTTQPVVRPVQHLAHDLVALTLSTGDHLTVTAEHPFRGFRKGWIQAKDLGPGDMLEGDNDRPVTVEAAEPIHSEASVPVYNFTVSELHDYRVGPGVLVHNPKSKKINVCRASIDPYGTVTETWNTTELQKRFPKKSDYQAIQRDIRFKVRRANAILKSGKVNAYTRVSSPVKTASKEWVRMRWTQLFGTGSKAPDSIRTALSTIRKHPFNQDVDEFLTRVQGGLTIREGMPENQGPLNSFVNSTSGAAMGALSRSGPAQPIFRFQASFGAF